MLRSIGVAGLLVLLPRPALAADGSAPGALPPVERLIRQLGDRNFRVREAAARSLEARGEEALPLLRKATADGDTEVRRRVEVLTARIERSVLLTPKRVTVVAKEMPASAVVADLAKQTGYRLQWQGDDKLRLTLDLRDVTYWQALEKIMLDAGATLNMDEQSGLAYLFPQEVHSPYCHHTGPFRLVAANFNYNKFVNLMNLPRNGADPNQQNDNLFFSFVVQSEPKSPLAGIGQPRLLKAEDENGLSLLPRNMPDYGAAYPEMTGGYRSYQYQANVQLTKVNRDSTKAKVIKGRLPVTLIAQVRPAATIEKVAKGRKTEAAAAELVIDDLQEQNKTYLVTVTVKRHDRNPEADPTWMNSVWQRLELYDARGRKFQGQGASNFANSTPSVVQGTFQFAPPADGKIGAPAKLVYNQWVTLTHDLEFEFHDLPLP